MFMYIDKRRRFWVGGVVGGVVEKLFFRKQRKKRKRRIGDFETAETFCPLLERFHHLRGEEVSTGT